MSQRRPKFSLEWASDAEEREYRALTGLPQLDADAANSIIRGKKPWEAGLTSADPWVMAQRMDHARENQAALRALRQARLRARDLESRQLRKNGGDYTKKDPAAVYERLNELGVDVAGAVAPLQPIRRELDAGSKRHDLTWQDSRALERAARQPPEQPSAEHEIQAATKNGRLDVRKLSAAAFSAALQKFGIR